VLGQNQIDRHVFISYGRNDEDVALKVCEGLTSARLPVFIDKSLRVGGRWEDDLEVALRSSFAVLVLWSPSSVASRWVKLEARYALESDLLCPAKIAPCELPFGFSDIQCARLEGWCLGADEGDEWTKLLTELGRMRRTPAAFKPSEEASVLFELGRRYLLGLGLPKNQDLAFTWFQRAVAAGHQDARVEIENLRRSRAS
jgi:TIR domain